MTRVRIRCLFRVSLRVLLLVLTVAGVLLGWKVRGVVRQRRAVAVVKANFGFVEYDYERNPAHAGRLPGPDWLCRLVGVDYFASVKTVFVPRLLPDTSPLAGLTELNVLIIRCEQRDLNIVGSLRNLRALMLDHGDFTDLSPLENLSKLGELHLGSVNVADEKVAQLQKALPHCSVYRESLEPVERVLHLDQMDDAELRATIDRARSLWK